MTRGREFDLEVDRADAQDVLHSVIRIHRTAVREMNLLLHGICEIRLSGSKRRIYAQVRTIEEEPGSEEDSLQNRILMDEEFRNRLGVEVGTAYRFTIQTVGRRNVLKFMRYLGSHEDPVVRILLGLAELAIIMTTIGIIVSVVLALLPP